MILLSILIFVRPLYPLSPYQSQAGEAELSQSQLDVLAEKLSPSFVLYNVEELFLDDAVISSQIVDDDGGDGDVNRTGTYDDDDEMDNEEKNLSDVEKRIQVRR